MNLQVGIRLHDLEPVSIEKRIVLASQKGFRCIHLASKLIYQEYKINRFGLTPGLASHIKGELAKSGLDIAMYGCYLNLANPDPNQLAEIIEEYKANIRFASYLGAFCVGTETGNPNTEYKFVKESHEEEALHTFIRNLATVVDYAKQYGITIAIEPVWKHIVYNPQRTRQVLDAIHSPNLQVIFDPVNMLSVENEQNQKELFDSVKQLFGDEIILLHAKDYYIENNTITSTAPGVTKNLHYNYFLDWLLMKKPYLQATMEDSTPDNAILAKEYLEQQVSL